jgi:hypothetical protein
MTRTITGFLGAFVLVMAGLAMSQPPPPARPVVLPEPSIAAAMPAPAPAPAMPAPGMAPGGAPGAAPTGG